MNLGYCCINLSLQKEGISTNRKMIKRTFLEKGLSYVSEIALLNLLDLEKIIRWNIKNNIKVYRMSSNLFPWMSEYNFNQLPNFDKINAQLQRIGNLVLSNDIRIGFHPGQFCVLPSPRQKVVDAAISEIDKHAEILDLMCLPTTYQYSINIHVGGSYGDKESALLRFIENYHRLSKSSKARLVVENDDKSSQYSVKDLYDGLYKKINIPITFDFFHHILCDGGLTQHEAANLAASTWPNNIRPLAHYSSSKKINEDQSVVCRSHADYIYEQIPHFGNQFDIELEAKSKDLALIKYRNQYDN